MATNQQEGPHTRNVLGHTEQTCFGCKWHESRMRKSGRDPVYEHFCKHPAQAHMRVHLDPGAYIGTTDDTPLSWCPVINKESEESDNEN